MHILLIQFTREQLRTKQEFRIVPKNTRLYNRKQGLRKSNAVCSLCRNRTAHAHHTNLNVSTTTVDVLFVFDRELHNKIFTLV